MKKLFVLLGLLIICGCMKVNHDELASQYRLDLQYNDNAIKFAGLNMMDEAEMSCSHTKILRSECYTSLVQRMMSKDIPPKKVFCDEIQPEISINMTPKAFELVYGNIDKSMQAEIMEKLEPGRKRIEMLIKIKEDCYRLAR